MSCIVFFIILYCEGGAAEGHRRKDEIIKTGNKIRESFILADVKDINKDRYEKEREAEIADAGALSCFKETC